MIEHTLGILCLIYVSVTILFITTLYISQYFNSPRHFQAISIACSIIILYTFIYLKLKSSTLVINPYAIAGISGFGFLLVLKFLELGIGHKWAYMQRISLKLVILYLISFPRLPESTLKTTEAPIIHSTRRESILTISRGIGELILFRSLLYSIPSEWLSLPSSSFSPIFQLFRYALLSALLYLPLALTGNIAFGVSSLLFNVHMNSMFPAFPFASTSLRDFWSYRWNNFVKSSLHRISFVVLPTLISPMITTNKTASGLFAFALSGVLHAYVLWFSNNLRSGKMIIFFLLHGILLLLEINIKLPVKLSTFHGKLVGWMRTMGTILITSPLFFDPFIETGFFANMK